MPEAAPPPSPPSPPSVHLLRGDAAETLRRLPDGIFHACVTSPGYFGLRDYGCDGQIGLERSPDEYAARLVKVFQEVRRTLRSDGSLWLVLGDSYAQQGGRGVQGSTSQRKNRSNVKDQEKQHSMRPPDGLKEKDLIGVPWLVAFALRADGWWLREAIVWRKESCMPESVRDRCTVQHEYVFHLTKSKTYAHDWYGIAEPFQTGPDESYEIRSRATGRGSQGFAATRGNDRDKSGGFPQPAGMRNARSVWDINPEPFEGQLCTRCGRYHTGAEYRRLPKDGDSRRACPGCGSRTDWLSHFAAFPTRLVARCLAASVPEGGVCARCGAPGIRILEKGEANTGWRAACGADGSGGYAGTARDGGAAAGAQNASATKARILAGMVRRETAGWRPACGCEAGLRPGGFVLDPFIGAGTTALAAARKGLDCVGIDLNPGYLRIAEARLCDATAKCLNENGARLAFAACETAIE